MAVVWLHTYGESFADTGRPRGDVRLPGGDERRAQSLTAITSMPEAMTYDAERGVLSLGDGEFGPVTQQVVDYTVGGRNVVKSWFNYRKKEPGGRRSSPLDDIHVTTWPAEVDVGAPRPAVGADPAGRPGTCPGRHARRDHVLRAVDDGWPRARGVRWPASTRDRRPHFGFETSQRESGHQPTLDA